MKVSELPYERVSTLRVESTMTDVTERTRAASSTEEILKAREDYLALLSDYWTNANLANTRYVLNMEDAFYRAENDYYDELGPKFQSLTADYAGALLDSPFRAELEKELSPVLFRSMEVQRKTTSKEVVDDVIEENRLISEYSRMMAAMECEFRGETMPRTLLFGYFQSEDRETRREAYASLGRAMEAHREALDDIYDRMVKVRDRIAKKLGYKNFIELGYYRMGRLCYDEDMVRVFRENILSDIVPLNARLRTENAAVLGLDRVMLYDNDVFIPGGNPRPQGDKAQLFAAAKAMYHDMSPITGEFFDFMLETDAFDVESRRNKWGGGFCTEFPGFRQPFILANFNGSAADVDVLTHEAGHALNSYLIADNRFALELSCGGMETAETHSMSMEFFTYPYMEHFFGERADEYRYMHTLSALSFLAYGTIVDAFQHEVYAHPEMTPAERNAVWKKLDGQFRPYLSCEGIPYLEEGTRWQYQMHIYESPFYYIDYVLAQTAAFRFFLSSLSDYDDAFARYLRFHRHGGEMVWTDLLEEAGYRSPFEPGALRKLGEELSAALETLNPVK